MEYASFAIATMNSKNFSLKKRSGILLQRLVDTNTIKLTGKWYVVKHNRVTEVYLMTI